MPCIDSLWLPYTQMATAPAPLPVIGAAGVRILLEDGRELIDGISSWWTMCHGYHHPHIREAVKAQLDTLPHVMFAGLIHEPAHTLARRLAALLPCDAQRRLDRVFFSESGSVSVEIALKMALQFWRNQGQQRTRFLAFRDGYHGDTLGALSVTDPGNGFHDACAAYRVPQLFADLPRDAAACAALDDLLTAHAHEIAAAIVEPRVQGAGGMRFHDAATLAHLRAACDRHGVLLIADEIMTGFGRTGTLFACESAGIVPDLLCLSKALTGGTLPLAATVACSHVFAAFCSERIEDAFMHGPTYMANPLACAAANASLDLFEREPRLAQVAAIETQMRGELAPCRNLPGVVDVRVQGAIGVVQLDAPSGHLCPGFIDRGVWVRPFGDIVYLMPPFVIEPADLEILTTVVCEVVADWSRQRG
ncbi:MAG: adenosylmethionine--8-amino-7-oxononanoate transaminase [Rhodocyclaceae bacterium]|nr:adenosylmethionine--8-amino-7-oxononanoate transaminase [Rhodocyclaceae bacterium]